jgi:hypothetical protein
MVGGDRAGGLHRNLRVDIEIFHSLIGCECRRHCAQPAVDRPQERETAPVMRRLTGDDARSAAHGRR